jgi:hypothetical protein
MPVIFDRVIVLNLVANTAIFFVAARLYLLPLIPRVSLQLILVPILLFHSMRHLGMMFVTRGATYPRIAIAVRKKSSVRRFADSHPCFRRDPARVEWIGSGQAGGVDFQYCRNN